MSTVLQARKLFVASVTGGPALPEDNLYAPITIADDAQAAALLAMGPCVEIVADAAGLAQVTKTVQSGYTVIDRRGYVRKAGDSITITQAQATALGAAVA